MSTDAVSTDDLGSGEHVPSHPPATVSDSGYCPRCHQYRVLAKLCYCNRYEVGESFNNEEPDWAVVWHSGAEWAAEKLCEEIDSDGDYSIMHRGSAEIWTRDGAGKIQKWNVEAEMVPSYNAREKR